MWVAVVVSMTGADGISRDGTSWPRHRARYRGDQARGQRSAKQKATETFRTTWVKKDVVKMQVMKIRPSNNCPPMSMRADSLCTLCTTLCGRF